VRLLDANILIYAADSRSVHHTVVRRTLSALLRGDGTVGIPHVVLLAFLRLATHPKVFSRPLSPEQAVERIDGLLGHPRVELVTPGERHWAVLRGLLTATGTSGNLTTDAHLAALALERGATLVSTDADFGRFPGLRVENPLLA
jgi:toxin-antitoxin system PIN domain toxin